MRAGLVLVLSFMGVIAMKAQPLEAYWNTASRRDIGVEQAISKVDHFVNLHQGPQSPRHLARVFRKFQHAFLVNYEAYADFPSLFESGTYDCLTATTLLNHILVRLGYQAEMVETTYHIFIKVNTGEGQILLETTDPVRGFVMDQEAIAQRIAGYRKEEVPITLDTQFDASYRYRYSVFRSVTSSDLTGLLLYNQAVKAYNSRHWMTSAKYLEASFDRYPNNRCYELAAILLRTIDEHSEITPEEKRECLSYLLPVIERPAGAVAANDPDPVSFR